MMEHTTDKIGIVGKSTEANLSLLFSHVLPNNSYKFISTAAEASTCDILYVPVSYPYASEALVTELVDTHNKKVIALIFDTLAIEPMLSVLQKAHNIVCYSEDVRHQAIVQGIDASKIVVEKISFGISQNYASSASDNIKILIPAKGLKNDQVDAIISLAYKIKESGMSFEFICFGTDRDPVTGGFSKYLVDTIQQKGFGNIIKIVKKEFNSLDSGEYKKFANYTLLLNTTDQNQYEVLLNVLDSLGKNIPLITTSELPQCDTIPGVINLRLQGLHDVFVKKVFQIISSSKLYEALVKEIEVSGVAIEVSSKSQYDQKPKLESSSIITLSQSIPRVLIQNRSNAFVHPGGDTVVMEKIMAHHDTSRVQIDVCVDGSRNPKDYDLVHLFNFAIKEVTEQQARAAKEAGTPYVVTTLYEDWPSFYNQMANMYLALKTYVDHKQPVANWQQYENAGRQVTASEKWDNSFAALNAEMLIATGDAEINALRRDYPLSRNITSIKLGCEVTDYYDGGKLFKDTYGISDFILCVGRLEWRKNQLMLLKALEEIDIPIVFAASSFTYQPEYDALCKEFKRRGKTHFIGRLTDRELASAYQAARVHALPSWFELPGLVTLEAARYGTPVVASSNGTIRDYLGNLAYYCNPDNAQSIKNAILEAYHTGRNENLRVHVEKYTWQNTVDAYVSAYEKVLGNSTEISVTAPVQAPVIKLQESIELHNPHLQQGVIALSEAVVLEDKKPTDDHTDYCILGDTQFKSGKLDLAKESYEKDLNHASRQGRANRSLGALELYLKNFESADTYFNTALEIDQFDSKALLGKGAILWEKNLKEEAFKIYKQASDLRPNEQSALLYLVNSAYELNKLRELEDCLRRYLRENPSNMHIQYCLAGCYFKQDKFSAALGVLERLFVLDSEHKDGKELKEIIEKKLQGESEPSVNLQQQIEIVPAQAKQLNKIESVQKPITKLAGSSELAELEELKATRQYAALIEKAEALLTDQRYCDTALDHFDVLRGEAYGCMGEIQKSREILSELKSRDVQLGRVLCDLGALELACGDSQLAASLFEEALTHEATNDNAFAGLAMCAQSDGRLEDAWTLFEEALRKNAQNIQAIYGLVQLGYEFSRLDKVEKFLREYLELKPIDISILYSLAGCLYAQGKSQEAVGELKNILLFDPENEPALELIEKINFEDRIHN